jgi:hypothetical protein
MLARGGTSRQAAPGGRSWFIRLLVAWLVLLSVLQLVTGAGLSVPVFPAGHAANRVVYGLAGLGVAVLLWRRHPRGALRRLRASDARGAAKANQHVLRPDGQ